MSEQALKYSSLNFKAPKIEVISFCVSFKTNVCTKLLWDIIRLETKGWIHFLDKLGTKQSGCFSNGFLSKQIVTFILYWCEHDSSTAINITDASAKFANIYIFTWPNIDQIKHLSPNTILKLTVNFEGLLNFEPGRTILYYNICSWISSWHQIFVSQLFWN